MRESTSLVEDPVIMTHSLITQCQLIMVQDPVRALEVARKAYERAQSAGNRRVNARALIWLAMAQINEPIQDLAEAKGLWAKAEEIIRDSDRDYLRWEFNNLNEAMEKIFAGDQEVVRLSMGQVLADASLDITTKKLQQKIISDVFQRTRSLSGAARVLRTTPSRLKRIFPKLRDRG